MKKVVFPGRNLFCITKVARIIARLAPRPRSRAAPQRPLLLFELLPSHLQCGADERAGLSCAPQARAAQISAGGVEHLHFLSSSSPFHPVPQLRKRLDPVTPPTRAKNAPLFAMRAAD